MARPIPLGPRNLALLAGGLASLVAGYLLLSSGSTSVAAVLLVLGYCVLLPLGIAL
jgi:adenylyl- and sulfurtransferase ThiI